MRTALLLAALAGSARTPAQTPPSSEARLAEGSPQLRPQAGKHGFELRGTTTAAYEQVAAAYGLKARFDPELTERRVKLHIPEVDFPTAARLLAMQTGTFLRAVSADTFFVASDTPAKRKEYELTIEQTFLLPAAVAPEEMTEIQRIVREMTGATRVLLDSRNRTVTIRDTPGVVGMAGDLIRQIEQPRGELLLEIELLEVDAAEARKLGVTPPTTAQLIALSPSDLSALQKATDLETLIGLLQKIFGAQGALGGSAGQIASLLSSGQIGAGALLPPLIAFGGGRSTILGTMPGAAAEFSEALTLVNSGRRILLRAQDGKPASFFVGERYPVTLLQYSASTGTGSGTPVIGSGLLPRSDFPVGQAPVALVAADFNHDGQRDLAVVNSGDNSISILLNQGNGNFTAPTGSPIALGAGQSGPAAIAAADVNGDGLLDLLVANQTSGNVTILLGKGDGTFSAAPSSPLAAGGGPAGIVTGDFNGDGKIDFAVSNSADNTISIFLGDGAGGFTAAPESPIALGTGQQTPGALVAADFNGDGKLDLAVVNRATNNVTVLNGNGDGTFTTAPGSPLSVGAGPAALAAGDLNGDGRADLAVVNQTDNTVSVLLNKGDGTFAAALGSPLAASTTPSGVAVADVNMDGIADLVLTNQGADSISIYLGLGSGLFAPRFGLPTAAGPVALVAADFNGDGRPDAAIVERTANAVSLEFDPVSFGGNAAGAGLSPQPYPGSEFVDLGLKLKATPVMHPRGEVTLQLELEIRALSGQSVNGIPILSNRTLSQTARLKENETTLIGGLLDREEMRALSGLPGFPGAATVGSHAKQTSETQMLILVTPRRLRLPEKGARPIYAGRGGAEKVPAGPPVEP
ncbi:MAG: FG-GAP-like repeat-containing protein [Acidobacteriia bacterium]|nr:FG-GAP-like repeat-containing protein [Terriglobia bacterium]